MTFEPNAVAAAVFAPKFIVVYVFVAAALFVQFRGRVRHTLVKQLTDHSTIMAPYNALMYLFSAVPNRPYVDVDRFPELAPLRQNWQTIRDEALSLFDEGHIRAAATYAPETPAANGHVNGRKTLAKKPRAKKAAAAAEEA